MDSGEAAVELTKAVIRGTGFPGNVPDTPEFRELYFAIAADVDAMAAEGISPEIPWDYNDDPDPDPIAQGAGAAPQIEQFTSEGLISGQLELAMAGDGEGILGQLVELAGSEAWRHERRGAHGQWTGGGGMSARSNPAMSVGHARRVQQQARANRESAQTAVASRLAEEHARKALEDAKAEVERVTQQLKDEAKTEENARHRTKLAVHAVLIIAGAVIAAILAHFDVSPVVAAFAGAMPLLGTELTDWKKKL